MAADLITGELAQLTTGVRRLIAPNPGMMTGPGTNTYLLGTRAIAVIDPGPRIESHLHLLEQAGNIRWILVTHTHPDHSPGALRLAEMTGAVTIGLPAPDGPHQDKSFSPDQVPADGETLSGPDFELQMLYTPGHASNHLCFLHKDCRWLFTGDHIMNGSTVVIDPPDGDMHEYLVSLNGLKKIDIEAIAPGHGDVFHNPYEVIDWIVDHRLARERKVLRALHEFPGLTLHALVPHVYADVDKRLHDWAERSLLAHLVKLQKDRCATQNDLCWHPIEA